MQNPEERDINDVFDDLLFSEEHLIKDGYEKGFSKGSNEDNVEGYHLGYHRGAEIGAELGYYFGVASALLNDKDFFNNKIITHLENIINLINQFPTENAEELDILGELDRIKTLYKKICSLVKIDATYPETDRLSF